jgi:hypothetical protein
LTDEFTANTMPAEEPDKLAKEIISLRDREKQRQWNFRSLWQSVSDLIFPQTYGITTTRTRGDELTTRLFDTTAIEESENMASGLANNLFPAGQQFFALQVSPDVEKTAEIKRYLSKLTEVAHEQIFNSNWLSQVSNTIQFWLTFGTGAFYSEWTVRDGLNYRDYSIGTYQCVENARGIIDTIIISGPLTARQLVQLYGEDGVGKSVLQAYSKPNSHNDEFEVIQVVRPRADVNPDLLGNMNMPWESIWVQERDAKVLEVSGFDEFPFAVPRYQVLYREVYGRGRGTALLPEVRILNRLAKDFQEMSNKWVNPPREILESFDGVVDVTPGANNYVAEMGTIKPIEMMTHGAYPVTRDELEFRRETVRQGFFKNAFEALTNLSGDRRTTTEIIERLKEGMKKLSKPLGRLFSELLTPSISRTILLLIRNGVADPPPPSLQGTPLKIEFINPLALALRDQQARGLQYWVSILGQVEPIFPGVSDNVDSDKAFRDLGESLGVRTEHIRPVRERDQMRQERAQQEQKMQAAALAAQAAESYGKTTKAPEEGSPAAEGF